MRPASDRTERCVFVYGTLTEPARVASLLEEWAFVGDAVLEGLRRVEGEYPTLAPGGTAEGRLLCTPEIGRLDAYEGVGRGPYVRVEVPREDGGRAAVYVGDPGRLGAPAEWPGEGPFGERVRAYVDAHDVAVRRARTDSG